MKRLGRLLAAFCAAVMVTGSVNVYAYTDMEYTIDINLYAVG